MENAPLIGYEQIPKLIVPSFPFKVVNTKAVQSLFAPERTFGTLIQEGVPAIRAAEITNALTRVVINAKLEVLATDNIRHFISELNRGATENVATELLTTRHYNQLSQPGKKRKREDVFGIGDAVVALLPHMLTNEEAFPRVGQSLRLYEERIIDLIVTAAPPDKKGEAAEAARQRIITTYKKVAGQATISVEVAKEQLSTRLMNAAIMISTEEAPPVIYGEEIDKEPEERWFLEEYLIRVYCHEETPPATVLGVNVFDDFKLVGQYLYGETVFGDYPLYEHEFDTGTRHTLKPEMLLSRVEIMQGVNIYIGSKVATEEDLSSEEDALDFALFFVWIFELLTNAGKKAASAAIGGLANPGLPEDVWEEVKNRLSDKAKEIIERKAEEFKEDAEDVIKGWLGPEKFNPFVGLMITDWTAGSDPEWSTATQGIIKGTPDEGSGEGVSKFEVVPVDRDGGGKYRFNFQFRIVKE